MRNQKYRLINTFNKVIISEHRSARAAGNNARKILKRRYLPLILKRRDGNRFVDVEEWENDYRDYLIALNSP